MNLFIKRYKEKTKRVKNTLPQPQIRAIIVHYPGDTVVARGG